MKCHPTSTKKCVLLPGWYEPFLQLIMMQAGDDNEFKIDQMQEELAEVVLEIIHFVMWKGIDGSDATVWRVGIKCLRLFGPNEKAHHLLDHEEVEKKMGKSKTIRWRRGVVTR